MDDEWLWPINFGIFMLFESDNESKINFTCANCGHYSYFTDTVSSFEDVFHQNCTNTLSSVTGSPFCIQPTFPLAFLLPSYIITVDLLLIHFVPHTYAPFPRSMMRRSKGWNEEVIKAWYDIDMNNQHNIQDFSIYWGFICNKFHET